jgi:hypothetical protein
MEVLRGTLKREYTDIKNNSFGTGKIFWTHFTKRNKNEVIDTFVEGLKGGAVQCGKVSRFHFQPTLSQGIQHKSFV